MKVAINGRFLAARPTGVQRFANEVVRRLAAQCEVALLGPRDAPARALDTDVERGRLAGPAWEQLELPRRAAAVDADVILSPASAAPRSRLPSVQVLHDVTPLTHPSAFRRGYRSWAAWAHFRAARRATELLTVSETMADEIARRLGLERNAIGVVRQGVSPLDAPATAERVAAVRERYGLPTRYVLATHPSDPRKGADVLTAVWGGASGSDEGELPALVWVGGGYAHVHRRVGASPSVRTLGHVPDEDLRALYSGAIAFLFPSRAEGFGRPPLEALACGTRAIVGPYPAAKEVLGVEADIAPYEPEAWREAIRRVSAEPEGERALRVARGIRWARAFTWDDAVRTILDACEAAAAGCVRRAGAPRA